MKRRTYLGTVAGIAAAATVPLAGCSTAVGDVSPPAFRDSMSERWTQIDEREESLFDQEVAGTTIEAKLNGVVYEDPDIRTRFEAVVGELDHPVSVLAGSRVAFSGDLESSIDGDIVSHAAELTRGRYESQLAQMGIENVERTESETITVDTGEDAEYHRYVGDLQVEDTSGPQVDLDSIPVAGDLASWQHDDSLLVAGAAYPAEPLSETIERAGRDASGIDVDFDPDAYRKNVRSIITGIE